MDIALILCLDVLMRLKIIESFCKLFFKSKKILILLDYILSKYVLELVGNTL